MVVLSPAVDALPGLLVLGHDHLRPGAGITPLLGGEKSRPRCARGTCRCRRRAKSITTRTPGRSQTISPGVQRPDRDDVEVGRDHDLAQEGAVLAPFDAADGDFRALADEVEQADARMLRAKRSLMISIVGMRATNDPSRLARLYSRMPPLLVSSAPSLASAGDAYGNSASTSSWKDLLVPHGLAPGRARQV